MVSLQHGSTVPDSRDHKTMQDTRQLIKSTNVATLPDLLPSSSSLLSFIFQPWPWTTSGQVYTPSTHLNFCYRQQILAAMDRITPQVPTTTLHSDSDFECQTLTFMTYWHIHSKHQKSCTSNKTYLINMSHLVCESACLGPAPLARQNSPEQI